MTLVSGLKIKIKYSYFMKSILPLFASILIVSCAGKNPILTFEVKETKGIERNLEYVEIHWNAKLKPKQEDIFSAIGPEGSYEGQILKVEEENGKGYGITAIFPVSVKAYGTKSYSVISGPSKLKSKLLVKGSGPALNIENEDFIADLTANTLNPEDSLSPGQIKSLILKDHPDEFLKRSNINIHWSPNFQGTGREYRTLSHLIKPEIAQSDIGSYKTTIHKEGTIADYPEIKLNATYEFYAGMPYFLFTSEILVEKDIELYLLRNDEMTLDSLFTHVIYKNPSKKEEEKPLYEKSTFNYLHDHPIKDDALWLAFYNKDRHFALGSIRLQYDNRNLSGGRSPLYMPHTKITAVTADGGRYWNRRLIHEKDTLVPKGSKYFEKNAYFILGDGTGLEKEINNLYDKLHNPLEVKIIQ